MISRRALAVSSILAFTLACISFAADDEKVEGKPFYNFRAKRATAVESPNGEQIRVISPTGIGELEIERLREKWPAKLVLRIEVKELEGIQLRNEQLDIHSFHKATESEIRVRDGDAWKESKGQPKHRVTIVKGDGYLDVTLPAVLLEGNPEKLHIHWVDYYRG